MASKGVSQDSKDEMNAILRQIDNYGMQVIFNSRVLPLMG